MTLGTRLGPYEIVSALGAGGMGDVYRARDTRPALARDVAIKVLTNATDEDSRRRFEQEARATGALTHPNILAIYDVGVHEGALYIVEELVDGQTLRAALANGPLTPRRATEIARAIAQGLAAAHAKGIVHRDLKPENVMLTSDQRVKILDFGLAKLQSGPSSSDGTTETHATGPGTVLGTVAYMSPEQVRGQPLDHRSDIFSLGVVLYEMLGGERPFTGETAPDTQAAILNAEPREFPATRNVPPAIERIVRRCLEKSPDLRFQSASDLSFALEPASNTSSSTASASNGRDVDSRDGSGRAAPQPLRMWMLLAAIAVSAVLGFTGRGLVRPSAPQVSDGASYSFAYGANYEITQLTTSGDAFRPAISPDGKLVAYVQQKGSKQSLWIQQVANGSAVQIVPSEPGQEILGVTISPDGNFVDFVRGRARDLNLFRVPLLGGTPRRLVTDVWSATAWSPDGRSFAFVRNGSAGGIDALIAASADGQQLRAIFTAQQSMVLSSLSNVGALPTRPAWSPTGEQLVVRAEQSGQAKLVFVDSNGRSARTVPLAASLIRDAVVWPDKDAIVLVSAGKESFSPQLFKLAPTRPEPIRITNDLNSYTGLTVTADGKAAISAKRELRVSVVVADSNTLRFGEAVRPSTFGGSPTDFRITWSGTDLLYVSTASGTLSVWRAAGPTQPAERLAPGRYPTASADGRFVYLVSLREPGTFTGLWRINSDGTGPVELDAGQAVWPIATSDGRTVVFVSNRAGLQTLWAVGANGGAAQQIGNRFAASPDISRDDRQIVFRSISQGDGLGRVLVTCHLPTCTDLSDVPVDAQVYRWTPDGRDIAYVDRAAPYNITIRSTDGKTWQLTNFSDDAEITSFAWSADGKKLAVARVFTSSDIVMFKGLKQ